MTGKSESKAWRSWAIWKSKESRSRPPADCSKLKHTLIAESRMKNVDCGCYGLTPVEIAMAW